MCGSIEAHRAISAGPSASTEPQRILDRMLVALKTALTHLGAHLPSAGVRNIRAAAEYVEIGSWCERHGFRFSHRVGCRKDVWRAILAETSAAKTLYLEFGVYECAATRFWTAELTNPRSCFVGFDTFTGLPEQGATWTKGQFDVSGNIPTIADPHVSFQQGLFQDTLPGFSLPHHDQLIVNLDADLYSSTACVLKTLGAQIKVGTYLYFDEFCKPDHEARAFEKFLKATGYVFRAVAADRTLTFVAFQRIT